MQHTLKHKSVSESDITEQTQALDQEMRFFKTSANDPSYDEDKQKLIYN